MDILLPVSGLNFVWQWGVLKALADDFKFWSTVRHIYGISGGAVATSYLYHAPAHDHHKFDLVCDYWEELSGQCRKKDPGFYLESGQDLLISHEKIYEHKPFFIGITKFGFPKIASFEWIETMTNEQKALEFTVQSGYIPGISMRATLKGLAKGVDGGFTYYSAHSPHRKDDNHKLLTIQSIQAPGCRGDYFIKQRTPRFRLSQLLHPFSKQEMLDIYFYGYEQGLGFIKCFVPEIKITANVVRYTK